MKKSERQKTTHGLRTRPAKSTGGTGPSAPRSRRDFLGALATGAAGALLAPHIWVPRKALAQTEARGSIKHLLYLRLSGGFRFQTAFNAGVSEQFNPFGNASGLPAGTRWGVGSPLTSEGFLSGEEGAARQELGMRGVTALSDQICVLPCVDHEPLSASADGNHQTGLERFYTGYAAGTVGFLTMVNYGLREAHAASTAAGETVLPAFVLGGTGMGRGVGNYAAYRPPVMSGSGFDRFGVDTDTLVPPWASEISARLDTDMHDGLHSRLRAPVQSYIETRRAAASYADVFNSDILKIRNNSDEIVDGISNAELQLMFGDDGDARDLRLALRLFHYGCPAVYMDQGGYDLHSSEENQLPGRLARLAHLLSAIEASLKRMNHPTGGNYWDHTLVVLGSEFSRTARGSRFNSARGSDHSGDLATRWMSMPFMGGALTRKGESLGETRASDLQATGKVYSYRSVLKTMLDSLGCDHSEFFPADPPFSDLFV